MWEVLFFGFVIQLRFESFPVQHQVIWVLRTAVLIGSAFLDFLEVFNRISQPRIGLLETHSFQNLHERESLELAPISDQEPYREEFSDGHLIVGIFEHIKDEVVHLSHMAFKIVVERKTENKCRWVRSIVRLALIWIKLNHSIVHSQSFQNEWDAQQQNNWSHVSDG